MWPIPGGLGVLRNPPSGGRGIFGGFAERQNLGGSGGVDSPPSNLSEGGHPPGFWRTIFFPKKIAPQTPQKKGQRGGFRFPPLWTLPLKRPKGRGRGPSPLDPSPGFPAEVLSTGARGRPGAPLNFQTHPAPELSRRYSVSRESFPTFGRTAPGKNPKRGPEGPLFGRRGIPKGGSRIAPLWPFFWGVWGAIFFGKKIVLQKPGGCPPSERLEGSKSKPPPPRREAHALARFGQATPPVREDELRTTPIIYKVTIHTKKPPGGAPGGLAGVFQPICFWREIFIVPSCISPIHSKLFPVP